MHYLCIVIIYNITSFINVNINPLKYNILLDIVAKMRQNTYIILL